MRRRPDGNDVEVLIHREQVPCFKTAMHGFDARIPAGFFTIYVGKQGDQFTLGIFSPSRFRRSQIKGAARKFGKDRQRQDKFT